MTWTWLDRFETTLNHGFGLTDRYWPNQLAAGMQLTQLYNVEPRSDAGPNVTRTSPTKSRIDVFISNCVGHVSEPSQLEQVAFGGFNQTDDFISSARFRHRCQSYVTVLHTGTGCCRCSATTSITGSLLYASVAVSFQIVYYQLSRCGGVIIRGTPEIPKFDWHEWVGVVDQAELAAHKIIWWNWLIDWNYWFPSRIFGCSNFNYVAVKEINSTNNCSYLIALCSCICVLIVYLRKFYAI